MICTRGALAIGAAMLLFGVGAVEAGGLKREGIYPATGANPEFKGAATRSASSNYTRHTNLEKYSIYDHTKRQIWYARIDRTYALHGDPDLIEDGNLDLANPEYDATWSLGGGIGRYFGNRIRGDLTYDYRFGTDLSGTVDNGGFGDGFREFELTSHVMLANLYYDFNRSGRINPYIGAGLGFAYHETEENALAANCTCTAIVGEGDNWSFAGALQTGVAVKLHHKVNLDIGYRFLYLGEVETGSVTASPTSPIGTISSSISAEDLHAHEFRFGLRYNLQ